jgi:hypothetical protein
MGGITIVVAVHFYAAVSVAANALVISNATLGWRRAARLLPLVVAAAKLRLRPSPLQQPLMPGCTSLHPLIASNHHLIPLASPAGVSAF